MLSELVAAVKIIKQNAKCWLSTLEHHTQECTCQDDIVFFLLLEKTPI